MHGCHDRVMHATVYRGAGSGGSTPLRSAPDQRPGSRSRKGVVLSSPSPRSLLTTTCALKTPSYGGSREKVNPRDLFTFSYKFSTDIPMSETQGVGCKCLRIGRLGGFCSARLDISDDLIPWRFSLCLCLCRRPSMSTCRTVPGSSEPCFRISAKEERSTM